MREETNRIRRVLIVEDEVLLAMALADSLAQIGHLVVGTATRLNQALALARAADIDFAVLDLNLAGVTSFEVADVLRQRGIPFVFATGYGSQGLSEAYRHHPLLTKPYRVTQLVQVMAETCSDDQHARSPTKTATGRESGAAKGTHPRAN